MCARYLKPFQFIPTVADIPQHVAFGLILLFFLLIPIVPTRAPLVTFSCQVCTCIGFLLEARDGALSNSAFGPNFDSSEPRHVVIVRPRKEEPMPEPVLDPQIPRAASMEGAMAARRPSEFRQSLGNAVGVKGLFIYDLGEIEGGDNACRIL